MLFAACVHQQPEFECTQTWLKTQCSGECPPCSDSSPRMTADGGERLNVCMAHAALSEQPTCDIDTWVKAAQSKRAKRNPLPTVALGDAHMPKISWNKVRARTSNAAMTIARYHHHDVSQDYNILSDEILGVGCSGKVVVARNIATGRKHALKRIRKDAVAPKILQQLIAEAEILLTLDHPHIARLNDVYDTDHELAFLTECLEGGELYGRLEELKIFPEPLAVAATRQMLLALGYLHSHNIVHRDLKLENFLYESDELESPLKVIDFGFSKVWDTSKPMLAACGSIAYVSPDVLRAKGYSSQCDLWSLGVIVFMLLSGYPPFHGSDQKMHASILAGKVDWQHKHRWSRVSQSAKDFVQSLLQTDPQNRLDVAGALNHEWLLREVAAPTHDSILSPATLRSMGSYAGAPSLKRAILQLLAKELAPSDVGELRRTFLELADDEEGTVSFSTLKDAIRCGEPHRDHELDAKTPSRKIRRAKTERLRDLFRFMDANGDDKVYYSDFVAAAMNENLVLREEHIRAVFHRLDADHSGSISTDDICGVIGDTFEGSDTSALMWEADSNNGEIDYESFMRVLGGACRLQGKAESMESFDC